MPEHEAPAATFYYNANEANGGGVVRAVVANENTAANNQTAHYDEASQNILDPQPSDLPAAPAIGSDAAPELSDQPPPSSLPIIATTAGAKKKRAAPKSSRHAPAPPAQKKKLLDTTDPLAIMAPYRGTPASAGIDVFFDLSEIDGYSADGVPYVSIKGGQTRRIMTNVYVCWTGQPLDNRHMFDVRERSSTMMKNIFVRGVIDYDFPHFIEAAVHNANYDHVKLPMTQAHVQLLCPHVSHQWTYYQRENADMGEDNCVLWQAWRKVEERRKPFGISLNMRYALMVGQNAEGIAKKQNDYKGLKPLPCLQDFRTGGFGSTTAEAPISAPGEEKERKKNARKSKAAAIATTVAAPAVIATALEAAAILPTAGGE